MDWVIASHPDKKDKEEHGREKRFLNNLHIRFDFNVDKKEIKSPYFFSRLIGIKLIEEELELLPIAELVLRGLAKAKFRNTAKIVVDGNVLYEHPEKKTDLRKTIDGIGEFSKEITNGKYLEIIAILDDISRSTALIKIKKIHSKKEHSVDIQIKGRIREEVYHTFVNYLNEKVGLTEE
jgi:hypothetical protein